MASRLEEFTVHEINKSKSTTCAQRRTDPLHMTSSAGKEPPTKESRIKVVVRKRPLNEKEIQSSEYDLIEVHPGGESLTIAEPKTRVDLSKFVYNHEFTFDAVFDCDASNVDIYSECCRPLIHKVFQGSKATCFAYGQTGSGKSWTMLGQGNVQLGLYVQAAKDIFSVLELESSYSHLCVMVSYFEIYGDKLYDLLQRRKELQCREDRKQKVNIIGLTIKHCATEEDLLSIIYEGNQIRATGATGANRQSSRSHAVLSIELRVRGPEKTHGRFSFIDLAGSERGVDTMHNTKQTRREGAEINKSLLALKECIRALDMRHAHKPFRQSMLTRVLKDSFIGNAYTLMIANVSPSSGCSEDTLNSLRYADRVKELSRGSNSSKKYNAYMPHKAGATANRREQWDASAAVKNSSLSNNSRPSSAELSRKGRRWGSQRSSTPNNLEVSEPSPSPLRNESGISVTGITCRNRRTKMKRRKAGEPGKKTSRKTKTLRQQPSSSTFKAISPQGHPIHSAPITLAPVLVDSPEPKKLQSFRKPSSDSTPPSGLFHEEDKLVKAHRHHIDEYMVLIKQDMQLLKNFDHLMSVDGNKYVLELKELLQRKMKSTDELWNTLQGFKNQRDGDD